MSLILNSLSHPPLKYFRIIARCHAFFRYDRRDEVVGGHVKGGIVHMDATGRGLPAHAVRDFFFFALFNGDLRAGIAFHVDGR